MGKISDVKGRKFGGIFFVRIGVCNLCISLLYFHGEGTGKVGK